MRSVIFLKWFWPAYYTLYHIVPRAQISIAQYFCHRCARFISFRKSMSVYVFLFFFSRWMDINSNHTDLSSSCFFFFSFNLPFYFVISSSTNQSTTIINRLRIHTHTLTVSMINDRNCVHARKKIHNTPSYKYKQQRTKKVNQPTIWTISFVHSLERDPASFIVYRNLFIRFINYQMHN